MTLPRLTRVVPVLAALAAASALFIAADAPTLTAAEAGQETAAEAQENPIEATEESIAAGRRIYGRFCRSCHGMRADGRGMAAPAGSRPANLIDEEWVHGDSDGAIYTVIREGVPPKYDMDAWEGRITDDEIWNVVNYLRSLAAE